LANAPLVQRATIKIDSSIIEINNRSYNVSMDSLNLKIAKRKTVIININTDYNVTIDFKKLKVRTPVEIYFSHADTLKLIGVNHNRLDVKFLVASGKRTNCILINEVTVSKLDLSSVKLKSLIIINSDILNLDLSNVKIDSIFSLYHTRLNNTKFRLADLPDTISMYSVKLESVIKSVDLTQIKNKEESHNFERTLKISNTDLDKIDLNYGRFNFHVDPNLELRNACWIYEKIIWHCEQVGLVSKVNYYKDVLSEIEDRHGKLSITNLINTLWWSRGHNKSRAVKITFAVFLLFFFFNFKFFNDLKTVYYPKSFEDYFSRIDRINKAFEKHPKMKWSKGRSKLACLAGVFFYSGLIFWNIKIDIEHFQLNKLHFCFIILFQHLIGLLFIANIIGFIIIEVK
jgi:hypothetical protein